MDSPIARTDGTASPKQKPTTATTTPIHSKSRVWIGDLVYLTRASQNRLTTAAGPSSRTNKHAWTPDRT